MNSFTSRLYEQYARIGKAISCPRRIDLLELLAQAPRRVEELAQMTGMGVANTSQHLQHLRQARLVISEKQGYFVTYRLAGENVRNFLSQLATLAESQLAEVSQIEAEFLARAEQWQSVELDQLQERLASGALLLDVRPQPEYEAGHIPGAVSMPLPELAERMSGLPRDRAIIAYCRGPFCLFALEAVGRLAQEGFEVLHLREGMAGWHVQPAAAGAK